MKKKWMAIVFFAAIFCSLFVVAHAEDSSVLKERNIFYSNTKKDAECSIWIDNDHKNYASFVNSGIEMHSDGYAMKVQYNGVGKTGVQLIRPDDAVCDISSYKENAYLSFWMYIETNSTVEPDARNLSVCLRSTQATNYAMTGYYNLSSDIQAGRWHHILISVDEMGIDTSRGEIDFSKIYRIDLKRSSAIEEDWNVYVQDICFYEKVDGAEASVTESGMDAATGMFYAKLQFSKEMDASCMTAEQFSLADVVCSRMNYDAAEKTALLFFDVMPERKKNVILCLSDQVVDVDGLTPKVTEFTMSLPVSQPQTAVMITKTPYVSGGKVCFEGVVHRIYEDAAQNRNVTVFTAIYQDQQLIASGFESYGELAWKAEKEIKPELLLPDGITVENLRAEIYILDTAENGRPLAEVLEYEL
ncbi:MAG: hypothetical protein U0L92_01275 [Clostridia bacterium]|nr:hypothetical protein [Clostridia bacterium]